jgi:hypothetical protein
VFESTADLRIASSSRYRYDSQGQASTLDDPIHVALTAGTMINVSAKKAVGLTAATTSDRHAPYRFEGRLRHWDGSLGIDFSAGIRGGLNPNVWQRQPTDEWFGGYTGAVGISRRYIGADLRMNVFRTPANRYDRQTFVTVRTGAWGAVVALPLVLLVAAFQGMD